MCIAQTLTLPVSWLLPLKGRGYYIPPSLNHPPEYKRGRCSGARGLGLPIFETKERILTIDDRICWYHANSTLVREFVVVHHRCHLEPAKGLAHSVEILRLTEQPLTTFRMSRFKRFSLVTRYSILVTFSEEVEVGTRTDCGTRGGSP